MNARNEPRTTARTAGAKRPERVGTAASGRIPVAWLATWQQQLDLGLRLVQAGAAAAAQLHEAHLLALRDSMARCEELHRQLLDARSPFEMWGCHCNWMLDGATHSLVTWKSVLDAAGRANAILSQGERS